MNEFHHLSALGRPCCCKWLFCIEFPEYHGRIERLLYTNRLSGCYFSGDARLTRHRGRHIDRLSLRMQSSSLKETLERQAARGGERSSYKARARKVGRFEKCGGEYWLVKKGVQSALEKILRYKSWFSLEGLYHWSTVMNLHNIGNI